MDRLATCPLLGPVWRTLRITYYPRLPLLGPLPGRQPARSARCALHSTPNLTGPSHQQPPPPGPPCLSGRRAVAPGPCTYLGDHPSPRPTAHDGPPRTRHPGYRQLPPSIYEMPPARLTSLEQPSTRCLRGEASLGVNANPDLPGLASPSTVRGPLTPQRGYGRASGRAKFLIVYAPEGEDESVPGGRRKHEVALVELEREQPLHTSTNSDERHRGELENRGNPNGEETPDLASFRSLNLRGMERPLLLAAKCDLQQQTGPPTRFLCALGLVFISNGFAPHRAPHHGRVGQDRVQRA
ncbi:hypothetical protein GLOTRDRAFT_133432 [Gloeophyllum trabeum ATCC 11539]|uniref:Uncharacterized protein n=1 Tax=Gloeophyllum trabeum (strain ATCC 11539 / FP-39264 / Madison 617) TaxID=670483 RepID=S7RF42_GLOTA|nr:uncharacterized protein GLOTRDRAFT_133432 [Gloeophyllum trabeum ATCC 11539]EPQ51109.1 hypothetical protein GLOTRDRAFT_133432 [Gloeophyllum trabeum ATCC 11539]